MVHRVVCLCRSAGCADQVHKSSAGVIVPGVLVPFSVFRLHSTRDEEVNLGECPVRSNTSTTLRNQDNPDSKRLGALRNHIRALVSTGSLHFSSPPTPKFHSFFDMSKDHDEIGPYRLVKAEQNRVFFELRGQATHLLRRTHTLDEHDQAQLNRILRYLGDWKAKVWNAQCADMHQKELVKANGFPFFENGEQNCAFVFGNLHS